MAQFNLKNCMQQMPGLFNTLIQSDNNLAVKTGLKCIRLSEGLDYSRLVLDEIEVELMADSGETAKPDNEMKMVESCSPEHLKTLLGAMTESTKEEFWLCAQEVGIDRELAVIYIVFFSVDSDSSLFSSINFFWF